MGEYEVTVGTQSIKIWKLPICHRGVLKVADDSMPAGTPPFAVLKAGWRRKEIDAGRDIRGLVAGYALGGTGMLGLPELDLNAIRAHVDKLYPPAS